ncbi:MAG TPA: aminomethyl-transferring glycine dehydrogenase subunit GcvPA [Acidimicrobiia bacterium]|nr:aminomethyl-transferring glycine dehydrogenase subunit GcvPA [Acidimicrobiia bacterium]
MPDYVPHTDAEIDAMLGFLGLDHLGQLYDHIPHAVRLARGLDLPEGLSESEVISAFDGFAQRNRAAATDLVCFAGGGAYEHELPSAVKAMASRSEFLTSYTPYQPELAQGVLQALFEYQSMLCALSGLDVANASLYDGASAAVEGVNLAAAATGRRHVVVSRGIHPHVRAALHTYAAGSGLAITEAPLADGVTAWPADLAEPACLLVAYPNYLGVLEDVSEAARLAESNGALLVAYADPVASGLLRSVGSMGADVAVGEGQPFGSAMSFGGPYVGLFAVKDAAYVRRWLPGRLVGETVDADERRAYVLTLSTREQHIRREKASSNVCTNQTVIAIAAAFHMAWLGPRGIREMALQCARGARYLRDCLTMIAGVEPAVGAPTLYEQAYRVPRSPLVVLDRLADEGFLGGIALDGDYPELGNAILTTVTETRTRQEIDAFAAAFEKACSP